jgi:tetratricopeptide (TPR) repeat protein
MGHDFEQLREHLEANPGDAGAFESLEAAYSQEGRWDALAELCEYRATYGVVGAEAASLLTRAGGTWLEQCGDGERALADFLRALDADPTFREALDRLDAVYRANGDWAGLIQVLEKHIHALEAYDASTATAPLRAHCHQQIGELWQQAYQRQDKAIVSYRQAFELDPWNVLALYYARGIYQGLGNYQTAAKLLDLEARAEQDPARRVALYRELGHVRAEQLGDLEGAVVALKRALAVDSGDLDVKGELALLFLRRAPLGGGDDDRCRAAELLFQIAQSIGGEASLGYCEAALDAWPAHPESLNLFEEVCRQTGQLGLLADRYRRLVEPLGNSPLLPGLYRRAGTLAMERGNVGEAIGFYEALAPLNDPGDHETLNSLYHQAKDNMNGAMPVSSPAAAGLHEVNASYGYDPLSQLRQQLDQFISQGQDHAAEPVAREILEMEPGDAGATTFLERRYRMREDWPGLYQLLLVAAQGQEISEAARLLRFREAAGIAEERLRDLDAAIAAMEQAVALAPDEVKLRHHLERLYRAAGRWQDLVNHLEASLQMADDSAHHVSSLRAIAEVQAGQLHDLERAAQAYERILEFEPQDQSVLVALEDIYSAQGHWAELVEVLIRRRATLSEVEDQIRLALRIASIYHEQLNGVDAAFAACQEVLALEPGQEEALARMESIDSAAGNWERLLETLEYQANLLPLTERGPLLHRAAALAEERLKDFERAAGLWQQVVAAKPHDAQAHLDFSAALERAGAADEAMEALQRALDLMEYGEERLRVERRMAQSLEMRGQDQVAFELWRSIAAQQDDPEALEWLARYYELQGEVQYEVEALQRWAEAEPDHLRRRDVSFRLARLLAGSMQAPAQAVEVLEYMLSEFNSRDREALEFIRSIHVDAADYHAAVEATERLVEVIDDVAAKTELLLNCADWYRSQLGNLALAIRANEQVLEIDPYRTDVIASLEELYLAVKDYERLLRLTRARYKAASEPELRRKLLLVGAEICEQKLHDPTRTWAWLRELFEAFPDQDDVVPLVEQAAGRFGLETELVGIYGELARKATLPLEQAQWWKKIGKLYAGPLADPARALEAMLRGFALDPEDKELLGVIDELALLAEDHERLVSVYEAVVSRSSQDDEDRYRRRLAQVLLGSRGHPELAFDQLQRLLVRYPEDDDLIQLLEEAAERSKRWSDLLPLYETRVKEAADDGEKIEYLLRCAQLIQESLNNPERAFSYVWDAVRVSPTDEHVVSRGLQVVDGIEGGLSPGEQGKLWNKLIGLFRSLEQSSGKVGRQRARYLEWIARIQEEYIGDGRAAFDTWTQATVNYPEDPALWVALERVAGRLNLWEELARHFKKVLERVLDRETAIFLHQRRAQVLVEQLNRPLDAAEHLWQIVQADPRDRVTRQQLVLVYADNEKWNELMLVLEQELALVEVEEQREIRLKIARIWHRQVGNVYEALEAYQEVLERWPHDEEARRAIAELERGEPVKRRLDDDELRALGLLEGSDVPSFDELFSDVVSAAGMDTGAAAAAGPDAEAVEELSDEAVEELSDEAVEELSDEAVEELSDEAVEELGDEVGGQNAGEADVALRGMITEEKRPPSALLAAATPDKTQEETSPLEGTQSIDLLAFEEEEHDRMLSFSDSPSSAPPSPSSPSTSVPPPLPPSTKKQSK